MASEADKMAALKGAYAEIMLNTAKESAARILDAEKKAIKFEKSLFDFKEEALAMILRVKSIMDEKVKEAEMTCLHQAKRIQELEAQLNEAENIIISLREKLERSESESKQTNSDLIELLKEQKANGHATSNNGKCQESQLSPDSIGSSLAGPEILSTSNTVTANLSQKSKDSNPDLASIIMRTKEPELYRNGCTQRIRAIEHNALTVTMPSEQSDSQLLNSLNEYKVSESKQANIVQATSSSRNGHDIKLFPSFRKPRTKCYQVNMAKEDSVLGTTKLISEERPHKLLKSHSAPISISCDDVANTRLGMNGVSSKEITELVQCSNRTFTEQIAMKPSDMCKSNDEVNLMQINESNLTIANQNLEEYIHVSDMKVDAPVVHSNCKDETTGNGKFLKYTFQRTRKRGSSSGKKEVGSFQKITEESKTEEKENAMMMSTKPTLETELPRDSRRIMQVARQLISLSEKKW